MTQTLAAEWARHQIRVNAVAPGRRIGRCGAPAIEKHRKPSIGLRDGSVRAMGQARGNRGFRGVSGFSTGRFHHGENTHRRWWVVLGRAPTASCDDYASGQRASRMIASGETRSAWTSQSCPHRRQWSARTSGLSGRRSQSPSTGTADTLRGPFGALRLRQSCAGWGTRSFAAPCTTSASASRRRARGAVGGTPGQPRRRDWISTRCRVFCHVCSVRRQFFRERNLGPMKSRISAVHRLELWQMISALKAVRGR